MKKTFIFIAMASLLMVTVMFSCKKETEPTNQLLEQSAQYSEFELKLARQLQGFKTQLDNPLKTGYTLSSDSARWYLQLLFNVDRAYTEEPHKIVRKDTIYYELPLSENRATFTYMNGLYQEMIIDFESLEQEIDNAGIVPVYGMLNTMNQTQSLLTLRMIFAWGAPYYGNYIPFSEDDDWYYGNMLGRCDGQYQWDSDAGEELEYKFLNDQLFAYVNAGSWIDFLPHISLFADAFYEPFYDEHLIYWEIAPTAPPPCIPHNKMNFYLNMGHNIMHTFNDTYLPNSTTLKGTRPRGYMFADIDVTSSATPHGTDMVVYRHIYDVTYGIRASLPWPPFWD